MKDLVSVIIPVYNEEKYLDDCIKSIIMQSYLNLEIIIVDDGSINKVAERCNYWANSDSRIKVLHKNNEGISSARVSGLSIANGQWVMFVDNDDILVNGAIETLYMACNSNVDISSGKRMDSTEIPIITASFFDSNYKLLTGKEVCELIGPDNQKKIIIPLWGKLYRKSFLDKLDLLKYKEICPTIYFEDVLITPILFYNCRNIALVDQICYIHREVLTSISRSGRLCDFYYEQIDSGNILLEFCKSNKLKILYSYELKKYYNSILRIWCLIDYQNIDSDTKIKWKRKIKFYYHKFLFDYLKYGNENVWVKIFYLMFLINKNLWGSFVYRLYFKTR